MMPQVTVYIRDDDLETWKKISKKSLFIHNALSTAGAYMELDGAERRAVKEHVKKLPEVVPEVSVPRPPDPETGYPCCLKARPCKHWVWDGNQSAYVNSLTGKEREAEL